MGGKLLSASTFGRKFGTFHRLHQFLIGGATAHNGYHSGWQRRLESLTHALHAQHTAIDVVNLALAPGALRCREPACVHIKSPTPVLLPWTKMERRFCAVEVERPLPYSVALLNLDQDQPLLHCTLQLGWIHEHLLKIMRSS